MIDLGTLGGTFGFAQCANHRHQVIGDSSVGAKPAACTAIGSPGCHAFFWQNGMMTDLGTLGGDSSQAWWLNDAGVIAGSADLTTPGIHHAVRWKDGHILDLGTVEGDACSHGRAINAKGQIVGGSTDCHSFLHAFVWEEGGPMLDLNTLIPPGSGLQLTNAININDRGEILAKSVPLGVTPVDDEDLGHIVLLVPCEEERGDCVNVPSISMNPSIAVNQATGLTITSGTPLSGKIGIPYGGYHIISGHPFTGFPLSASGGTPPYKWNWSAASGSSLPPGLKISVLFFGGYTRCCLSIPVIAGTPTTSGTYDVVLTVTDSASPPAQTNAKYAIKIQP